MVFDYVDIGTSDFETSLDVRKPGENILLVEPLFQYLKNLPDEEDAFKLNVAISDHDSWGDIYYVPEETIQQYNLPGWVRGCNSLNKPHPNVQALVPDMLVKQQSVRIISFSKMLDLYNIDVIKQLKTDTEGHDHIIAKAVIESIAAERVEIGKIIMEYKVDFGNTDQMDEVINQFYDLGFFVTEQYGDNVVLEVV